MSRLRSGRKVEGSARGQGGRYAQRARGGRGREECRERERRGRGAAMCMCGLEGVSESERMGVRFGSDDDGDRSTSVQQPRKVLSFPPPIWVTRSGSLLGYGWDPRGRGCAYRFSGESGEDPSVSSN
eukprot:scaffold10163_cov108-Isochrysis_galbana.AAC.2